VQSIEHSRFVDPHSTVQVDPSLHKISHVSEDAHPIAQVEFSSQVAEQLLASPQSNTQGLTSGLQDSRHSPPDEQLDASIMQFPSASQVPAAPHVAPLSGTVIQVVVSVSHTPVLQALPNKPQSSMSLMFPELSQLISLLS